MINLEYSNEDIILTVIDTDKMIIPQDELISSDQKQEIFNIVNDLIANGAANDLDKGKISIPYENLNQIDNFEFAVLQIPEFYPFDIFVDLVGSGLKDLSLKLKYSFQDFAHKNGSGNIIFKKQDRIGAHLKNDLEYLLNPHQFKLIYKIEAFNQKTFTNANQILKEIGKIQQLAANAKAILSKVLVDTEIITPEKIKFELIEIDKDKFKILPIVKDGDNSQFQKDFKVFPKVKSEYYYRDSNNKKVRVIINDEQTESDASIKTELTKLKSKSEFNSREINEMYEVPTKFWDSDVVDLTGFGERVFELGIYKPKFYPFISPYKSQWIPGITIEDKKNGTRHIKIANKEELEEIRNLAKKGRTKGEKSINFKGEDIDLTYLPDIIRNAEKQLNNPTKPVTSAKKESEKSENESKVLIIKENAEHNEYFEAIGKYEEVKFNLQHINNLKSGIELKDHQKTGVAWLQTLSTEPYNLPGVLLADDMGLGKTIQVLYFIEWFLQKVNQKPVLVVAPVSLLENWENEYNKFFPKPTVNSITFWGPNVKEYINPFSREETIKNLSQPGIYLTTYETLRKQQIPMGLIDWGILVLDEAQKIKTPGTFVTNAAKALKADFKIAMTGTPVENSLLDLWCIIDFCSPGLLENAKSFSKNYQRPLKQKITDIKELTGKLRNEIGDTLLRRMKTDVAKDLPAIDYVKLREKMPPEQYDSYLRELASIENLRNSESSSNPVLKGIFNLRSISDHPYLKHYQIENISTNELKNTSAKLFKVISILEEIKIKEEKVIIFTENKSMQRVLRRIISETFSITPSIINGQTPTSKAKIDKSKLSRQQEIDKYQRVDGFNAIIMSPIAAGFGLNITEANHIIHYTRHWNPAKEQQATDRAYRIGQQKPVKVYYPLAVSPNDEIKTFDIILDELLNRKSSLASNTLFPTEQIEITKEEFISSMNIKSSTTLTISTISTIEDLDKLKPDAFEAAVAILLGEEHNGDSYLTPISNDKGADILLFCDECNFLVQVKQSTSSIGISSGQEINYALPEYKKRHNCDFIPQVITNNYYNKNAVEMAKQNKIELLNREYLKRLIDKYQIQFSEIDSKITQRIKY